MAVHFRRLRLRSFKAFEDFTVPLSGLNVLVGPNNAGKSTLLGAFRALQVALRRASSKKAEILSHDGQRGWRIEPSLLPISVENVHTDYIDVDTVAEFSLSNGSSLALRFPRDGGCVLTASAARGDFYRPTGFKKAFPVRIGQVPTLGPVEQEEAVLDPKTVKSGLGTHRASRHFRNFWYQYPESFDEFADLVARTWPGMELEKPNRPDGLANRLVMFVRENRITRELFWSGFGFQVWCQLLTHLIVNSDATMLVLDEPEIYLHPELQRRLLGLLRGVSADVLLATHSTELMSEADPGDLLLVEKHRKRAHRLSDLSEVQSVFSTIGSVQNIALAQLSRNRRALFVEGAVDYLVLRRFAQKLGLDELADGMGITAVESGGASTSEQVKATAWGLQKTLPTADIRIGLVLDRDYRCAEEVNAAERSLAERLAFARLHRRKELENYLLDPGPLQRAVQGAIDERARRTGQPAAAPPTIAQLLVEVTESLKPDAQARWVTSRTKFLKADPRDDATITAETLKWFEEQWANIGQRILVVPGKTALKRVRDVVRDRCSVNLTWRRIVDAFRKDEVPEDLRELLEALDEFRAKGAR